ADNHVCFQPTHFLQSDAGEIRGYFSTDVTPLFLWSHTGNEKTASLRFVKQAIEHARLPGKPVIAPCTVDSPFVPVLPGLGFLKLGNCDLWTLKGGVA